MVYGLLKKIHGDVTRHERSQNFYAFCI